MNPQTNEKSESPPPTASETQIPSAKGDTIGEILSGPIQAPIFLLKPPGNTRDLPNQPWDEMLLMAALGGLTIKPVEGDAVPDPSEEESPGEPAKDAEAAKARLEYRHLRELADALAPLLVCYEYYRRQEEKKPPTELDELLGQLEARRIPLPLPRFSSEAPPLLCLYFIEWKNHPYFAACVAQSAEKWVRKVLRLLAVVSDDRLRSDVIPPQKSGKPAETESDKPAKTGKEKVIKLPAAPVEGPLTMKLRNYIRQLIKDFCKELPRLPSPPAKRSKDAKVVSATGDLEAVVAWELAGLEALGESKASPILAWALSDAASRLYKASATFTDPATAVKLAMRLLEIRLLLPVALAPMAAELLSAAASDPLPSTVEVTE